MVILDVPEEFDLNLAARVARERYQASLSLAAREGSETVILAGDEGTGRRTLDFSRPGRSPGGQTPMGRVATQPRSCGSIRTERSSRPIPSAWMTSSERSSWGDPYSSADRVCTRGHFRAVDVLSLNFEFQAFGFEGRLFLTDGQRVGAWDCARGHESRRNICIGSREKVRTSARRRSSSASARLRSSLQLVRFAGDLASPRRSGGWRSRPGHG